MNNESKMDEIAAKLLEEVIQEVFENQVMPLTTALQTRLMQYANRRTTKRASNALRCTSGNGEHYYLVHEKCVFCQHERE